LSYPVLIEGTLAAQHDVRDRVAVPGHQNCLSGVMGKDILNDQFRFLASTSTNDVSNHGPGRAVCFVRT
jgi:hypothetical protein